MTFSFGFMGILFTCISWQVKAYGFSSIDTGIAIVLADLFACISVIINGYFFKSNQYKRNTIILAFGAAISLIVIDLGY